MKAYSLDLRQKIINIYNREPISQRLLAKRFCVSLSFVQTLLKRYRTDGTIAPLPHGGGQTPKLMPQQLALLTELVAENNNATLEELCALLYYKTQVRLSRSSMGRIKQQLEMTRKKNSPCP